MPRKTVAELKKDVRILDQQLRMNTAERDKALEEVAELKRRLSCAEEERGRAAQDYEDLYGRFVLTQTTVAVHQKEAQMKTEQTNLLAEIIENDLRGE